MNNITPKVTIVTVCFNALEDLKLTLNSIKSLNYANFEYIVIDGNSTDGTQEYLGTEEAITFWISEDDDGIYDAMNKALKYSNGEWVIFMNAGDEFANPDVIELAMEKSFPNIDFIYGDRYRVEQGGIEKYQKAGDVEQTLTEEVVYHQALFNRTSRLRNRPYNNNYALAADYEYVVNAWKNNAKFSYINIPICKFKVGGRSRTEHIRGMIEAIKVTIDYQKDKNLWRESSFFVNFIANHMEYALIKKIGEFSESYPNSTNSITKRRSDGNLILNSSSGNKEFERYLGRVLRPLSNEKLGLDFTPLSAKNDFNPRITIVTVVFNDKDGYLKTKESIDTLTYRNIEHIIVDGASTDGTSESLSQGIRVPDIIVSEPDNGIYDAMNKGIALASGEYIIFMNAGDTFAATNVLEAITRQMIDFPDVVYGHRNYIKLTGEALHQESKDMSTTFERMPYCHQAAFVKKSVLQNYLFDRTYKFSADYNQVVKMYIDGLVFKQVDITVCNFAEGGKSESGIRPYLEVAKIQLDNAPEDFDKSKSVYLSAFKNNFSKLFEEI